MNYSKLSHSQPKLLRKINSSFFYCLKSPSCEITRLIKTRRRRAIAHTPKVKFPGCTRISIFRRTLSALREQNSGGNYFSTPLALDPLLQTGH
jgi:hypothetical protein